uniref:Uncharacterized protein n=1 Tax=Anguilla anguilla TaxID=7936 RepID=A0A0E9XCS9_ANGAN
MAPSRLPLYAVWAG